LVPLALKNGIVVAIVTFSRQVELIKRVLELNFPEVYQQIPIRGDDDSWVHESLPKYNTGKQSYMASAAEELAEQYDMKITRSSTLLIDDDHNNIRVALENLVRAVHFNIYDIRRTIDDLKGLQ
jgi:hypothetical protein